MGSGGLWGFSDETKSTFNNFFYLKKFEEKNINIKLNEEEISDLYVMGIFLNLIQITNYIETSKQS